jgi:hypothetical protein
LEVKAWNLEFVWNLRLKNCDFQYGKGRMQNTATRMPSRLEWAALTICLLLAIAFGAMVEMRSAFLSRRMGDLDCYLRPAWAALVGKDIYDIKDDNGWHYNYPPLYAILLIPLADPPYEADAAGFVPFPVSVAIVYALNLVFLAIAVHVLAGALERHSSDPAIRTQPRFCRRWWALRTWPILACLASIAHTAMRGQVNLQVLALFGAWVACSLDGRRRLGGFFLAIAMCIKVIPIYLLIYPLWRKDGRSLTGSAAGLFVGLVAVPMAVMGPTRTAMEYEQYGRVLFGPLLKLSDDITRDNELLGMHATDSMGIKNAVHAWLYPNQYERPMEYHGLENGLYVVLGVLTTLAVLWRVGRTRESGGWSTVHVLSAAGDEHALAALGKRHDAAHRLAVDSVDDLVIGGVCSAGIAAAGNAEGYATAVAGRVAIVGDRRGGIVAAAMGHRSRRSRRDATSRGLIRTSKEGWHVILHAADNDTQA